MSVKLGVGCAPTLLMYCPKFWRSALQTPDAIKEHIENLITTGNAQIVLLKHWHWLMILAHRQRSFLESSATPSLLPSKPEQDALIGKHTSYSWAGYENLNMISATYESEARNAQDRAVKLLTRKVEKADLGNSLVKDIEVLLQETRIMVGWQAPN